MPTYEYQCKKCGVFELEQRITEDALTECPTCAKKGRKNAVQRIISAPAFHLKGGGWYKDLYSSAKKESSSAGESGSGGGEASTSGDAIAASSTESSSTSTEASDSKGKSKKEKGKTTEKKSLKSSGGCGSGGCGCH